MVYWIWKILNKVIPHICFIPWKQLLHEKVDRQDTVNKQRLKSCHQLRNVLESKWGPLANNLTIKYRNKKPILWTYTYLNPTSLFDEARDKWPNIYCFYRNMTTSQRRETERLSPHIKSKLHMEKNIHYSQSKIQLKKYVWLRQCKFQAQNIFIEVHPKGKIWMLQKPVEIFTACHIFSAILNKDFRLLGSYFSPNWFCKMLLCF